ncbi:phage integrase family protein [Burkholderia lata]|uniref:Phage integrase family protein n=1 Tax=Burkholderia lata (strain ATCC 17760 / DSM 23089 / LMG 22485 / NCIMB 9086 / R18194 / 383) TaxID=482957 RepID=A0A6P2QNE9_BURL3|nr:phage integrase family protein [Burkholderia lata]VWC23847.1 phage integrase family protein [Burkholderia lata]
MRHHLFYPAADTSRTVGRPAYALTVLSALFRWLIEQRYVLANPFASVKVRGHAMRPALDTTRGFTEGEWLLLRTIADGLEWPYGWS